MRPSRQPATVTVPAATATGSSPVGAAATAAPAASPVSISETRSRLRSQRSSARERRTAVSASGRSTPSRCPMPRVTGSASHSAAAVRPAGRPVQHDAQPVQQHGHGQQFRDGNQPGQEGHQAQLARGELRPDEDAGVVPLASVVVPAPGHGRPGRQHRQCGDQFRQWRMLVVVRDNLMVKPDDAGCHVDRLVEGQRVEPGFPQAGGTGSGEQHQEQQGGPPPPHAAGNSRQARRTVTRIHPGSVPLARSANVHK